MSIISKFVFGLNLVLIMQSYSLAQDRGMKPVEMIIDGKNTALYNESHALLIGASSYTAGLNPLPGVAKDIATVEEALIKNGFDIVKVMNPDAIGLPQAFSSFIAKYGQGANNRLLFYFAGHGYTEKMPYGEDIGYICPVDAPNPNIDAAAFQMKAMPMAQIEIFAKQIRSKHALFIFDACFSGSIFSASRAVPEIISYKTTQPVRQFISSGSADETVPDVSIFQSQFVRALDGDADANKDGFITGTELGEYLQSTVVNYSYGAQHPQYGKIRNPNLDKGDFVFIVDQNQNTITPLVNENTTEPLAVTPIESSNEMKVATLLKEARAYNTNKDYFNAKEKYLAAYKLDSKNGEILSELAFCFVKLKDYQNAINYYQSKIDQNIAVFQDYYNLGKVYYNLKDNNKAENYLEKACNLTPDYLQSHLWLARTRVNLDPDGVTGLAINSYEKVIELGQSDPNKFISEISEANYYLAWFYFNRYNKSKIKEDARISTDYCRKVISLDPNSEDSTKAAEILKILEGRY